VLLVLYIWKNSGYNIILFLAALNAIPTAYYEAADLDGAGKFRQLFGITLPLIVPYLFFIVVISVINSFKSFREAFILFGSHPHQSIYMIQHFMNNNFQNLNYIRLSVGAILIFTVIFTLMLILFRIRTKIGDIELWQEK
jgi:multiple sugar transport system permease protein